MDEKYKQLILPIIFIVISWVCYALPIPLISTILGSVFLVIGLVVFSQIKEIFNAITKAAIIIVLLVITNMIYVASFGLYFGASKSSSTGNSNIENPKSPPKDLSNQTSKRSWVLPPDQYAFHRKIEDYKESYSDAMNDLAKNLLLNKRDSELCSMIGNGSVVHWIGLIERIGATGDGDGYIKVKLPDSFGVMTSNNLFSDSGMNTLIKSDSPLFDIVLNLKYGDRIEYSGKFIRKSNEKCLREMSMTNDGSIRYPEFTFRFSEIRKID